ncbi:YpoC family protein [Bacillus sp. CGMCC 1.16607]|uniref:YpoC family protein n=1 Tax=Bacillus sp. CGMCC 1.16607 TaxID=3351842 RepID=UPI003633BE52
MKVECFENHILLLLDQWSELKLKLIQLFENRDRKNTLGPMQEGIDLFLNFLSWSNDIVRDDLSMNYSALHWKPVNVNERLEFIKQRPNLYHSFIQLVELMSEQEKQYRKKIAIKKVTKQ